ncbi:MAG: hypothetical protein GXO03_06320 [Aquificae bacterium]|nr:hypothetical protein [Aquificota bacterium]
MEVFASLESWDVDDPLALLFLGHYHQKGLIKLLGVHLDEGSPRQLSLYARLLKEAELELPLFAPPVAGKDEVHPSYAELLPGYEREKARALPTAEAAELLKNRPFRLLVGGSLTFASSLLKAGLRPVGAVVQGGFAGVNVTGRPNAKFGTRNFVPSFNLNKDFNATLNFFRLRQERPFPLLLVSKNVNHLLLVKEEELPGFSETPAGNAFLKLLRAYLRRVRPEKSLHDVYASLALLKPELFSWEEVKPVWREGKKYPLWGSVKARTGIKISVSAAPEVKDYALLKAAP